MNLGNRIALYSRNAGETRIKIMVKKNGGNDFIRTAIFNVCGPGENRTLVQTSLEYAFYMLSSLFFVGMIQANKQAEINLSC